MMKSKIMLFLNNFRALKISSFLILLLLLSACRRAEYPLSSEEQALKKQFERECQCRVSFAHSKNTNPDARRPVHDELYIGFSFDETSNFNFCLRVSEHQLKQYSKRVFIRLMKVIQFKQYYKTIDIYFSSTRSLGALASESDCARLVSYNIKTGSGKYEKTY